MKILPYFNPFNSMQVQARKDFKKLGMGKKVATIVVTTFGTLLGLPFFVVGGAMTGAATFRKMVEMNKSNESSTSRKVHNEFAKTHADPKIDETIKANIDRRNRVNTRVIELGKSNRELLQSKFEPASSLELAMDQFSKYKYSISLMLGALWNGPFSIELSNHKVILEEYQRLHKLLQPPPEEKEVEELFNLADDSDRFEYDGDFIVTTLFNLYQQARNNVIAIRQAMGEDLS